MKFSPNITSFFKSALATAVCFACFTALLSAKPVPDNLGYGLDKLVESNLAIKEASARGPKAVARIATYNGYTTQAAADYAAKAITDEKTGRVTVDITLRGNINAEEMTDKLQSIVPSFTLTARDDKYRGIGIIEGFVALDDVPELAKVNGVKAVFLALKPDLDSTIAIDPTVYNPSRIVPSLREFSRKEVGGDPYVVPGQVLNKIGTTFDQGVTQHRVDKINNLYDPTHGIAWNGNGISIAAMSDSYDTRTAAPHASTGVTNFDLPGSPSNPWNTKPVVVLKEGPAAGSDEGRGMLEIIYKMAPKARIAFASGFDGEVAFANYIRAMAGIPVNPPPFPNPPAGDPNGVFKADVIVDDISYGGEPFYGESIIGGGVDDAAAVGVSYFSSAGNNIGINAYESMLRWVPNGSGNTAATNTALAGTNIDLTGVPANLYQGGFHNFNPNAGQQDVACLWNMPTGTTASTEMQWDDPYDIRDPVLNQPPVFSGMGTIDGVTTTQVTFSSIPPFTAGSGYVITETATSGNFDGVVTVLDPMGNTVVSQDTGTDEVVTFFAPTSGQYSIRVTAYSTTTGSFDLTINTTNSTSVMTSDLNLLVFNATTGAYISGSSLTTNNIANNRPVELGTVRGAGSPAQCQFLIARSNVPMAPQLPTRVRISTRGNGASGIGPAEYFTYNAVTTKGHATAAGGNGVAAYSPFRPNIPESFTSPGPATIIFDKTGARLPAPVIRLQPTMAAIDAANTSFFGSDSGSDLDTNPNFSGTSAAAPHAAALAGLVLQAKGGPGMVSPAQMRTILQRSAYPHDLDPSFASGTARTSDGAKVTITVNSDNDSNTLTGQNDPNSISVSYVGPGSLASLVFNPAGNVAQGGNVTGGNNGYYDNAGSSPATVTYFANYFPGLAFLPATKAFTLGNLTGLTAGDITAPQSTSPYTGFSNLAPAPANGTTQFLTMTIGFPTGNFTGGKVMRFTVGRGAAHSATVTGGTATTPGPGTVTSNPIADLFGGGVFLPEGNVVGDGMVFSGTTTGGGTFQGVLRNRIGSGYTPVDGYGVINAESAVNQPLP